MSHSKPLYCSLHFRRDQNHYFDLTSNMFEQLVKKTKTQYNSKFLNLGNRPTIITGCDDEGVYETNKLKNNLIKI